MANVAHSTLTGSDLHEPKGVAAAAANKVYVSDGVGSGAWTAHSTFAGIFGTNYCQVREQQTPGTNGAAKSSSAWSTLTLNTTVANGISGVSLASNQLTLPSGTYFIDGWASFHLSVSASASGSAKLRVRNITAGTTLVNGGLVYIAAGSSAVATQSSAHIRSVFSLGSSSAVEIQYYTTNSNAPVSSSGAAETEVYSDIFLWKIA